MKEEEIYAYKFEGKRYDVGDTLGYLVANIEYALRNPELKNSFKEYLNILI